MINTQNVINDFRLKSNFKNDGEVALFRKFAQSILANSNGMFIDETHGNVAKIEFTSAINGIERCEISDLLLVIKHLQTGDYRATFWQAKKERHPRWPVSITNVNFDFEAQFNQWELLSQRPTIKGKSRFFPPPDLLSNASSPSIGSFGVFYELNGNIELNYSVAEAVASSGITKHPRMVINGQLDKYSYDNQEAIVKNDIASFLDAINTFSIGALLDPTISSHIWLASYLNAKCKAKDQNSFIENTWFDDLPSDIQSHSEEDGDGISALMIEIESDLPKWR